MLLAEVMKELKRLSAQEQACFRLYAAGMLQKEIAFRLGNSEKAVHQSLAAVRRKLGMRLPPAIVAATKAGFFDDAEADTTSAALKRRADPHAGASSIFAVGAE